MDNLSKLDNLIAQADEKIRQLESGGSSEVREIQLRENKSYLVTKRQLQMLNESIDNE